MRLNLALALSVALLVGAGFAASPRSDAQPPTGTVVTANAWATHDPESRVRIDHKIWRDFLSALTQDQGAQTRVAYVAFDKRTRKFLDDYIEALTELKPSSLTRDEQLAYWLNLHNAMTVRLLERGGGRGPIDRHRTLPTATTGPFAERTVIVEGRALSIDAIVHEVLRPNFRDRHFHYGLFLGALGGPRLAAFEGQGIATQLEDEARRFINDRGVRVDGAGVELSSLYDWYGGDFGGEAGVLNHVREFAAPPLKTRIAGRDVVTRYRFNRSLAAVTPRLDTYAGGEGGSGAGARQVGGGS